MNNEQLTIDVARAVLRAFFKCFCTNIVGKKRGGRVPEAPCIGRPLSDSGYQSVRRAMARLQKQLLSLLNCCRAQKRGGRGVPVPFGTQTPPLRRAPTPPLLKPPPLRIAGVVLFKKSYLIFFQISHYAKLNTKLGRTPRSLTTV